MRYMLVGMVVALSACADDGRKLGDSCLADSECTSGFCYDQCLEPDTDLDDDGLSNREEFEYQTAPSNPDTDGDGEGDQEEAGQDSDGDDINDALESSLENPDGDCEPNETDATNDTPDPEVCEDGVDNDCDGETDEGCAPTLTLCAENEYVSGNVCTPCPTGATNPPGDDPTGPDTSCIAEPPALCEADEYVLDGVCTPCPAGETNAPGDDPAGANTGCDAAPDACTPLVGFACEQFDEAYIKAPNTLANGFFGGDVAIVGDTLVVGARGDASNAVDVNGDAGNTAAPGAGAVFVYARVDGTWTPEAYIKPLDTAAGADFGVSVAFDGTTIVVGASGTSAGGTVYTFQRSAGSWAQVTGFRASTTEDPDEFGASLALRGSTLVVGAPQEGGSGSLVDPTHNNSSSLSGAVHTFVVNPDGTVSEEAYIKAPDPDTLDGFGEAVALNDDATVLLVGAPYEQSGDMGLGATGVTDNGSDNAGAVFVYVRPSTSAPWAYSTYWKAPNTDPGDQFGASLAILGDVVAIGAPREQSTAINIGGDQLDDNANNAGAVYVYRGIDPASWALEAYVKAPAALDGRQFGHTLLLDGSRLLVGVPGDPGGGTGLDADPADNSADGSGAVFTLTYDGNAWAHELYIKASNTDQLDHFGESIAVDGDTLVVGADLEASGSTGINSDQDNNNAFGAGAVFVRRLAPAP